MANSKKTNKKKSIDKLTYDDIEDIVEYLVSTKAWNNTFDCWSVDDIAQEIRIICFKALTHFDSNKVKDGKHVNFFGRCVDNALMNLKRDNYVRYKKTCDGECELLHGNDAELSKVCNKWMQEQEKIKIKLSIRHPIDIDVVGDIRDSDFEEMIEVKDIKQYLLKNIDESLKPALMNILGGNKRGVDSKDRRKIQLFVKRMLRW